jgi:hypothetical protein
LAAHFPSRPERAIPSTVFKEEHKLYANDTALVMKHYPPAHTDSDISVHFTEADIFHIALTSSSTTPPEAALTEPSATRKLTLQKGPAR